MLHKCLNKAALAIVLCVSSGCAAFEHTGDRTAVVPDGKHISGVSAPRTTVFFVDGSSFDLPQRAKIERRYSQRRHAELITVRAKKFMAAYQSSRVLTIQAFDSGRSAKVDQTTPADGGGDTSPIGNCGADQQACPTCDLCSGSVPAGQPSDASCLDTCGINSSGAMFGRIRVRTVDPENTTCAFDLSSGDVNCDFEATNSGGGSGSANHKLHYVRISAPPGYNYSMDCSPFPSDGIAAGTFTDSRGSLILFPAQYTGGQPATFVVPSSDSANTKMNENFFTNTMGFQGYCRGFN